MHLRKLPAGVVGLVFSSLFSVIPQNGLQVLGLCIVTSLISNPIHRALDIRSLPYHDIMQNLPSTLYLPDILPSRRLWSLSTPAFTS